jgi:hypothetical protein
MLFIIKFLTGLAGFPILSIKPKQISIWIIWGGQLVGIGIILVAEVYPIYFSI